MKRTLIAVVGVVALAFAYGYGYAIGRLSAGGASRFELLPVADSDEGFWHGELAFDTRTGQICRVGNYETPIGIAEKAVDPKPFPACKDLAKD
jgi:hypothetical protein